MPIAEINHVNTDARNDDGPFAFEPKNAVVEITYYKDSDSYYIEVNDQANVEFRMKLGITQAELDQAKANPKIG